MAVAGEEETEEAAVETLKGTMSKQDHSKAWGQHNTWLKKQPQEEQEAHAQKSKKEKGEAVVLWLLKTKVQRFQHHSQEVKGSWPAYIYGVAPGGELPFPSLGKAKIID